MTAPLAPQDTQIHIKGELVSKPYIDITLHLMRTFGVSVSHDNYRVFHIRGVRRISRRAITVEGDASSASYFGGGGYQRRHRARDRHRPQSVQGDTKFADVLEKMGARITGRRFHRMQPR